MGAEGQAHEQDADTKDKLNHRVVPIILVPGVMGTRLDISGAASDWDPDDTVEMGGWVGVSRRRCAKHLNFATNASVALMSSSVSG